MIDIQVETPPDLQLSDLASLHRGEEEAYPVRSSLMTSSLKFDNAANTVVESSQVMNGYRFADSAGRRIVQTQRSGFTYSHLAPYTRWEEWQSEANRLWLRYLDITGAKVVRRIAVRYINRLDLVTKPGIRLRDYVRVFPNVPNEFPQTLLGVLMRLEMPLAEVPGGLVILSLGRTEPPAPGYSSVLLDLDMIVPINEPFPMGEAWNLVEQLHTAENKYFEGCITDLTRELFK